MKILLRVLCTAAGRAKGSGAPSAAPIDLAPRAAAVRVALTGEEGASSAFHSAPGAYDAPVAASAAYGRCATLAQPESILAPIDCQSSAHGSRTRVLAFRDHADQTDARSKSLVL